MTGSPLSDNRNSKVLCALIFSCFFSLEIKKEITQLKKLLFSNINRLKISAANQGKKEDLEEKEKDVESLEGIYTRGLSEEEGGVGRSGSVSERKR